MTPGGKLQEQLAVITASEQERVGHELVEEHFLNAVSAIIDPGDRWPTLNKAALYGLAGEIVQLFEPHTEADPVGLLVSFLSEAGAMVGRAPHLILDGGYHPLLFWPVTVGSTSKSRKGTSDRRIKHFAAMSDPAWTRGEYKGTLSSGEGLAFAVRDAQYKDEPVKKGGQPTGETMTICIDPGVTDKRLILVQSEFGVVLRVMERDGNSLSGVLRNAWDGDDLTPMTKANRVKATAPHIAIVGHVTKDELLRNLTATESTNGFANRFVWFLVRRSKELPFPSAPLMNDLELLAGRTGKILQQARGFGAITMADLAKEAWTAIYHDLSADRPGMAGSLLARGEAQVMRLAALYACLDGQATIDLVHLKAALALWQYAESSTKMIFGQSLGNPTADRILQELQSRGDLADSQISDVFGRHVSATKLELAKTALLTAGLAHCVSIETGGRPRIVWRAGAKQAK